MYITHGQRSSLAKFRCGVAPLCEKTSRYKSLPEEESICHVFNSNTVASKYHAIMSCQLYDDIREELLPVLCPVMMIFITCLIMINLFL